MKFDPAHPKTVLHLVGSGVSSFYHQLSIVYAKEALQLPGIHNYYAVVHPDGFWQLGKSLDYLSPKLSLKDVLDQLPNIDLVVPHMFCFPGMTSFRGFFEDILGLPVVGSPAQCMALAANKSQTRNVVAAAGVRVANAQQLRRGDILTLQPPFVVKPNSEDNSLGVTLVWHSDQISAALQVGFEFDHTLLIEEYIPGREIRVAVIEHQGTLYVPAMIEYLVSDEHPIRTIHDKLELQADGTPAKQPDNPVAQPVCPATLTPDLFQTLANAAKQAHLALGCRDYSLYDFRVHAKTNDPYLLEAGLFWSFGAISMISRMLVADGQNLENLIAELWSQAMQRSQSWHSNLRG